MRTSGGGGGEAVRRVEDVEGCTRRRYREKENVCGKGSVEKQEEEEDDEGAAENRALDRLFFPPPILSSSRHRSFPSL